MGQEEKEKIIKIPYAIAVRQLAELLGVKPSEVITRLIKYGVLATINEEIDFETAEIIALDFGFKAEKIEPDENPMGIISPKDIIKSEDPKKLKPRPPVVTIMGHIDHGKTSLLDYIRQANVVEKEAGGITQHISAYQVEKKGKKITFIDTPGHEAFVAMRARGAQVTDIAVLVIAADDGVKPQTIEAANHAKAAGIPIIVAITKIDKPEANIEKVKQQLPEIGLNPEEWGGKTIVVPVSAKTGEGIDELLEMILLVAEIEGLKANPEGETRAVVLESHKDVGKGPVSSILIQNGSLKTGDVVVAGEVYGKVRLIEDFLGRKIQKALPSQPVLISGLSGLPASGDVLIVVAGEKLAKEIVEEKISERKRKAPHRVKIKPVVSEVDQKEGEEKTTLRLILKTDVAGTLEAIESSLKAMGDEEIKAEIVAKGIGDISDFDVKMAKACRGEIFGFNVGVSEAARKIAKSQRIKIHLFNVIYDLIDTVHKKLESLIQPQINEVSLGQVKVLAIFKKGKEGSILGGQVISGRVEKGARARVEREGEIIGEVEIIGLKQVKESITEASVGTECGIEVSGSVKFKENDLLEVYKLEESKKSL